MNDLLTKTGEAMTTVKAMLDAMAAQPGVDKRSLSIARTQFETGFLWAASAVGGPSVLDSEQ